MTSSRSVGIDVLRGLAVLLVMARHAFPELFSGAGVVGVVMFFALSGHLITASLRAEHERTGTLRLGRFYRRRALRLVPALLFLLVGFSLVVLLLDPLGDRATLADTWLVALTWTANLPFGLLGLETSDAAFHLWTLAGEEQFYLLWPVLLLWAWPRRRTRTLVAVGLLVSLTGIAATALWLGAAADVAYALPTSWAACFVIGGASALLPDEIRVRVTAHLSASFVPLAVTTLLVLAMVWTRGGWSTYLVLAPVVSLLSVALLLMAREGRFTLLGERAWVWLGQRSYAAYLWNHPLSLWLSPRLAGGGTGGGTDWAEPLAFVLTLVMAEVSWRCVEQPVQRWSARGRGRHEPRGVGVAP